MLALLSYITALSWNGCKKILKFILHEISFLVKEHLESLKVSYHNNVIPTVTFH